MSPRPKQWRQPLKWGVGLIISIILTLIWVQVFHNFLGFNLFTVGAWTFFGFIFIWQVTAHLFEMWPATLMTENRKIQGIIMTILGIIYTIIAVLIYQFVTGVEMANLAVSFPLLETAIFFFAAWVFWFNNWPASEGGFAGKQPLQGFIILSFMIVGAVVSLQIGLDVPWIWFPIALSQLLLFEYWPLHEAEQPLQGIGFLSYAAVFTGIYAIVLQKIGISFFNTLEGQVFTLTIIFWFLSNIVLGNMWPWRKLQQPIKGFVSTIVGIILAIITHLITFRNILNISIFSTSPAYALIFWASLDMWIFIMGFTVGWWYFGYSPAELSGEVES